MNETRGLWRGKRLNNGEWVQGLLAYRNFFNNSASLYQEVERDGVWVDPSTLGECTGLRDKNGKLIFEGDIVQTKHGRLCKIVWRSNSVVNCWDIVPLECKHRSPDEWDLWDSKNLLVVGNIYDNPELLKRATGEDIGNAAKDTIAPAT